jgi:beta-glucosidase
VHASVARPVTELKRFRKIRLEPGQTADISFTIGKTDMSFYDNDLNFVFEPGKFIARVGSNCRDVKCTPFMF